MDEEDETLSFAEVRVMISAAHFARLRLLSNVRVCQSLYKVEGGRRGVALSQLNILLSQFQQEIDDDIQGSEAGIDRGDDYCYLMTSQI